MPQCDIIPDLDIDMQQLSLKIKVNLEESRPREQKDFK